MPKPDPIYEKRELARLKAMMADPRYWKTMDPAYVESVRQGFEALYDTPPPAAPSKQAVAREGEAANELGLNGPHHGQDKDLAHVSPGEIVVPVSAQTPQVLNALYAVMGDRMAHYVVGSGYEQRNPTSGLPSFADNKGWFSSKRWHFEERDARNRPLPRNEKDAVENGFIMYPDSMAVFHDNDRGAKEKKYAHPDGREVVYDGDTGRIVHDPNYRGSFNYIHQELPPNDITDIAGWAKYIGSSWKHYRRDILPYWAYGSTRKDYTNKLNEMQKGLEPHIP